MPIPGTLFDQLLGSLPEGRTIAVQVGLHWIAVVVEVEGKERCGLSSIATDESHHLTDEPSVRQAGSLADLPTGELARLVFSERPTEVSIGMAAVNALLPPQEERWVDMNAGELIARRGAGKRVVLVGHFPFVPSLRERLDFLQVLELKPRDGDLPAIAAREVIPGADVLAITSMTLLNHTFNDLIALRSPETLTMLLGPTTPLSPILFDHGVDILSGSVVEQIGPVLKGVGQAANFRQLHRLGVRLVSMAARGTILEFS